MSDQATASLRWIDCNARIGRWSSPQPEQFTEPAELMAAWDRVGIDGGLVYHSWAWEWSAERGNRRLLDEIDSQERLRPCFVVLPPATREMDPAVELAACIRHLHGAVRIFPKMHNWSVRDWCAGALFEALADQGVPVLVDIKEVDWDSIAAIVAGHPDMPVIVLNFYYRVDRWIYPLLERHDNFHIEANTYGVFRGIEGIVERFGPERLVFGTGLPELEAGGPMALISYAEISDEDRRLIAGGNLLRLLGEEE
ncbi:MAG: amidohydrolase family protein [Armatimonadota bacterium]